MMKSLLRRWPQRLAMTAAATVLAVVASAQPAQAAWLPFGSFDYWVDCMFAGEAGNGDAWYGFYCEGAIGSSMGPYQLFVWVDEA